MAENPGTEPGAVGTETVPESPEAAEASVLAAPPDLMAGSVGEYARLWLKRVRSGESGALPVILGVVVIVLFFQIKNSLFLSAGNLVNLMTQAAFIITLAMAEVFVLLLGEIDLAAGFTAACGAVIALWMLALNWPWWIAVLTALAATGAYGALQGYIITRLRLPSFVVTLAGFLGLSGVLLYLIDATGKIGVGGVIRLNSNVINDIEAGALSPAASWIVMVAIVALAGLMMYLRDRRRRINGLVAPPVSITLLKIAVMAVAGIAVVLVGNANRGSVLLAVRGLPYVVLVVLAVLVVYTIAARPHPVRPVHLRDRRQYRGGPAGRCQHQPDPGRGLRALRAHGRHHRDHLRLLPRLDLQRRQRRAERAVRGGRRGHRRHQPVRRPRQDAARRARRPGRRRDRQRADAARPDRRRPAHVDGPGPARRGLHRRADPPGPHPHLRPAGQVRRRSGSRRRGAELPVAADPGRQHGRA